MTRILVALDSTNTADVVLQHAIEIARAGSGAKLRLMRAIPERVDPPVANLFEPGGVTAARIKVAEDSLELFEACVPDEYQDGVSVELGPPADAILRASRAYNADWIVIGAHGYGLVERVLGTTAASIVNRADRPVIVVRQRPPSVVASADDTSDGDASSTGDGLPAEHFPLVGAATLAGAASGAVVGALAGPPGAIIGAAIGTAVGLTAGSTMDVEDHRATAHDRELDDAIGVTRGDLGAQEAASAAFGEVEQAAQKGIEIMRDDEDNDAAILRLSPLAGELRAQHAKLEDRYCALLASYRGGDWPDVLAQWNVFEPAIREHMRFEEEAVFPFFRTVDSKETDALLADHEELRSVLTTLGVNIELHAVPMKDAEELVRRLRAHAEREEKILYPWIDATLATPKKPSRSAA